MAEQHIKAQCFLTEDALPMHVYAERRRRFMSALAPGALVLLQGAAPRVRSNDTEYPFRQDSDFHYLTGFDHPDAVAVLHNGDGGGSDAPDYTLFVQPRDPKMETWDGARPGVEGAREIYGATAAFPRKELEAQLPVLLKNGENLYHVWGRNAALDSQLIKARDYMRLVNRAGGANPPDTITDPRGTLHEMRLRKTPEELQLMRRAASITYAGHRAAAARAQGGVMEYEIEALLAYHFRKRGGAAPAYGSICGGGVNAVTLHYINNHSELKHGDVLLVDAGCEYQGYASDVTRTYPVGGKFSIAQNAVYEVVLAAQQAAIAAARPGATLPQLHKAAVEVLTQGMVDLHLLPGPASAAMAKEKFRKYYMHGTSHWIGLDVHDAGAYYKHGTPRLLEPGMVFSVEPGLYIRADDADAPPELRGLGVRIEDTIAITNTGCENLNEEIPREAADVEQWVQAGAGEQRG